MMWANKIVRYTGRMVIHAIVMQKGKEILKDAVCETGKCIVLTGTVNPATILFKTAKKQIYKAGLV